MTTTLINRRRRGLLALAALPPLAGCIWEEPTFEQTTTLKPPSTTAQGFKVDARNGHIIIHKGAGELEITATLRMVTQERLGQVSIVMNPNSSGVLEIYAKPPEGGWRSNEACSFDITAPLSVPVELRTDNGRIESAGMSGPGAFKTSNGSVTVLDHGGPVKADTSNGHIEITNAAGPVQAETSNGRVTVRLADSSPGPVKIRTSNGSVTLELGSAFRGELSVHTSNGSIRVPQSGGPLSVSRSGRHSATVRIGDGEDSRIETSNGGVTIRR